MGEMVTTMPLYRQHDDPLFDAASGKYKCRNSYCPHRRRDKPSAPVQLEDRTDAYSQALSVRRVWFQSLENRCEGAQRYEWAARHVVADGYCIKCRDDNVHQQAGR